MSAEDERQDAIERVKVNRARRRLAEELARRLTLATDIRVEEVDLYDLDRRVLDAIEFVLNDRDKRDYPRKG